MAKGSIENLKMDSMGRVKMINYERTGSEKFFESIGLLEERLSDAKATRWSYRGLVSSDTDMSEIDRIVDPGRVLEQTYWTAPDGSLFVWLAANSPSRVPTLRARNKFIDDVSSLRSSENEKMRNFFMNSVDAFEDARKNSWTVECYDPKGDIGSGISDPNAVSEMLRNVFYIDREVAERMTKGEGYSRLGHYVFVLKDSLHRTLCMYILAQWPWGIEGTYTIVGGVFADAHGK